MFSTSLRLALLSAVLCSTQASADQQQYDDIAGVQQLLVSGDIEVQLRFASAPQLLISGDQECLARLQRDLQGQRLTLQLPHSEAKGWSWLRHDDECRLVAELSLSSLNTATLLGASELHLQQPWQGEQLQLQLQGAAHFSATTIAAEQLVMTVDGAAHAQINEFKLSRLALTVEGAAHLELYQPSRLQQLQMNISGASHLALARLDFGQGQVEISGASHVQLGDCEGLSGAISGVSHVELGDCRNEQLERSGMISLTQRSRSE